jgi:hypothetical protein
MNLIDRIQKYKLNDEEAAAYKLALLWMVVCQKELKGYRFTKLRKNGDPRKSIVWKYCLKLYRETRGLVEDYELYFIAQISVLKSIRQGDIHALIEPQCLVGRRAWRRWKLWKNLFDKKMEAVQSSKETGCKANTSLVCRELKNTKTFFIKHFGREPKVTEIKKAVETRQMLSWLWLNKVSPYYIVLSKLTCDSCKELLIDCELYTSLITQEIKDYFSQEFSYESS